MARRHGATMALAAAGILLLAQHAPAQCGGAMEIEHEVEVPGTGDPDAVPPVPNQKIKVIEEFKVTKKGNPGAVSYKLKVSNPNARDVSFVICAMVDVVRKPDKWMPHLAYRISKVDGTWECSPSPDASWTPSYHFGCRQIELKAGAKCVEIFCKEASPICLKPNDELKRKDKLYTYVDILKDCPTTNWLKAGGQKNIWLVPDTTVDDEDVASTWITGVPPKEIWDPVEDTSMKWSLGNFFTMADVNVSVQAHLSGKFTGLPPGTPVMLDLPATGTFNHVVPPSGILQIEQSFVIPSMPSMPADGPFACLQWLPFIPLPDGHTAHFLATVTTGPNPPPPYTGPGEFMYTVQRHLVQDSSPPEVLLADVTDSANCRVHVLVSAFDQVTQPSIATAAWASDPDGTTVLPIVPGSTEFGARSFAGLVPRSPVSSTLIITVVDEAENERVVTVQVAGDPDCSCPDLDGDGLVGGGDLGILLSAWGPCGVPCPADLTDDGVVNGADLGTLLSGWGTTCAIPACPGNFSCYVEHLGGGCEDQECCGLVTALDPACAVWWEEGCADAARRLCAAAACGEPGAGDCFAATYGPFCADDSCCQLVCAIDSFCCEIGWDLVCAYKAGLGCGADCCEAHSGPGCGNPTCQAAVCAVDPFCCQVSWDGLCANQAALLCADACGSPAICPPASNDCFTVGGPGCADSGCCAAVCALDPFCCRVAWDGICVGEALQVCEPPPCGFSCAPVAVSEGEPCGADANGGCNSAPNVFGSIACGLSICGSAWADGGVRDTDWYVLLGGPPGVGTLSITTTLPMVIGLVNSVDCATASELGPFAVAPLCGTALFQFSHDGVESWLFAGPNGFAGFPCGTSNAYQIDLVCFSGPLSTCCIGGCVQTGCDAPSCQTCVCAGDPFCCDTCWDGICAGAALPGGVCAGVCPCSG